MMSLIDERRYRAFSCVRPNQSSNIQVGGYHLPPFLENNFAKGWKRPDTTETACCPLSVFLGENETQNILDFVSIGDKASFRTASMSSDVFVRDYYLEELEMSHLRREAEIILARKEAEEEEDNRRQRRFFDDDDYSFQGRQSFGSFGSP